MNIEDRRKPRGSAAFIDLPMGGVFVWGEAKAVCMRMTPSNQHNAVNLRIGSLLRFSESDRVDPVNAKVVIEND